MSQFMRWFILGLGIIVATTGASYAQTGQQVPVFKAGPYITAVGPTRFRLKVQITTLNPTTMTMTTHTFTPPGNNAGFPQFTIQQSVPIPPMNYSCYIHKLDGGVTDEDVLATFNGPNVMMTTGIVEMSPNGEDNWTYYETIQVVDVILPPAN